MSQAIADAISDVRSHYYVPDWDQEAGVEDTEGNRAALKRKAADISTTQYSFSTKVYSFSTKKNRSEAAVDELLEMLSNVCTICYPSSSAPCIMSNNKR